MDDINFFPAQKVNQPKNICHSLPERAGRESFAYKVGLRNGDVQLVRNDPDFQLALMLVIGQALNVDLCAGELCLGKQVQYSHPKIYSTDGSPWGSGKA